MNQPAATSNHGAQAGAAASGPGTRSAARRVPLPYWLAEFRMIRGAVLTAAATVLVGATLVAFTASRQQTADAQRERAQRLRDTAYARHAHVDNEKRDIRNFQQRYIELVQRGLIGEERRLDWVDAIRQAQEGQQLPPLSYEMDPQQPVRLEAALDLGEYQLRGSQMRLHMTLLHEMQLFDFFSDLHERGFFAVQGCALKRLATANAADGQPVGADSAGGAATSATLGADCTLNWITMTPAAAGAATAGTALNVAASSAAAPKGQP